MGDIQISLADISGLKAIDTRIVMNESNFDNGYGYLYNVSNNTIRVGFKKYPTVDSFVQILYPNINDQLVDDSISYTLKGLYLYDESSGNKTLIATPNIVEAVVEGDTIIYPNIFNGADLIFNVGIGKLKEVIRLDSNFMNIIPDPFVIGYNPDLTKVVIETEINTNGKLIEIGDYRIACENQIGLRNLHIEPIVANSVTGEILPHHCYQYLDKENNSFMYGLSYVATQRISYPIQIDPTVSTNMSNCGYIQTKDDTRVGLSYVVAYNTSLLYLGYEAAGYYW